MSRGSFEISETGLKLPYGRFLSDSAGGYTLILLIIIASLNGTHLPSWIVIPRDLGTGTAVLLTVPLLLIGSPLGLLLNGLGWLLLGWIQIKFIDWWVKWPKHLPLPGKSTMRAFHFKVLDECFHIHKGDHNHPTFYDQVATFDEILQVHFPEIYDAINYISGAKQFVRNLILISIVVCLYSLSVQAVSISIIALIIALSFIVFLCQLELYQALQTVMKVYMICLEKWSSDPYTYRPFEKVTAELIAIAKKTDATTKLPTLQFIR